MVGCDIFSEIQKALEQTFTTKSQFKNHAVQTANAIPEKGNLSMGEFLVKMKTYVNTLASVGHKLSKQDQIFHILSYIRNEYDPVMESITSRVESYTF